MESIAEMSEFSSAIITDQELGNPRDIITKRLSSEMSENTEEKDDAPKCMSGDELDRSGGTNSIVTDSDNDEKDLSNGHKLPAGKRKRSKVQRLSESLSDAHVKMVKEKAKAAEKLTTILSGRGTPLGDIPRIEEAIRKNKPVDLKTLHVLMFGRPGAASEIRSNLRKFCGFSFTSGSQEYEKKLHQIKQRSATEIREALRILSLEVSGTQAQLSTRILDFLLEPTASIVKYKGKVVKHGNRGRPKSTSNDSKNTKPKALKKKTIKTVSSEGTSRTGDDHDSIVESVSESEDDVTEASSVKPEPRKRGRPLASTKPVSSAKQPKQKITRVILDESSDSEDSNLEAKKANEDVSSDEDKPLSSLVDKKSDHPTEDDLRKDIADVLANVNLERTSLKVVREKIFARYPDVDLSEKKEFVNTAVKEFLSKV